jgi:hypothetical protein
MPASVASVCSCKMVWVWVCSIHQLDGHKKLTKGCYNQREPISARSAVTGGLICPPALAPLPDAHPTPPDPPRSRGFAAR